MYWYFENINPPHRKFYSIQLEQSLFDVVLIKTWGRIGSRGRKKVESYPTWFEAYQAFARCSRRRFLHGYSLVKQEQSVASA